MYTAINAYSRTDLIPDGLEAICLEIRKNRSKPFFVITWYRPPNSPVEILDKFEILIRNLEAEDKEYQIVGDLNCNLLDVQNNANSRRLMDIMDVYQLKQIITEPTRITNYSQSLIDVFITNNPHKVNTSGVVRIGISDHYMIYVSTKVSIGKSPPKIVESRSFKNYNKVAFKSDLLNMLNSSFIGLELELDPNVMWLKWRNVFTSIAEKHAPLTTRKVRSQHTPWLTSEIKKEMNHRDYLKQKATRTNSRYFYQAYKVARNKTNKIIQKAKSEHFKSIINSNINNPKQLWKSVNIIRGKGSKTTNISSLNQGDDTVVGDKNIAETLNSYFVNVGPSLSGDLPESEKSYVDYVQYSANTTFTFNDITENDTLKLLHGLKTSKAAGPAKISARLVKDSAEVICQTLTLIFNRSLQQGIFPEDLKTAFVSPIFKDGDKADCSNYRPISVLSIVAKIFEKIVYNQLITYIDENNILSNNQFGFRKSHSTSTSMLDATNN